MNNNITSPSKLHRALVDYFRTMGFDATADSLCSEAGINEKSGIPFNFIELWNDYPRLKLIADAQQKADEKRNEKEKSQGKKPLFQQIQEKVTYPEKIIHQFPTSTISKLHPSQPIIILYDSSTNTIRLYDSDTMGLIFATTITGEVLDVLFCDIDTVSILQQDVIKFLSITKRTIVGSAVLKGINSSTSGQLIDVNIVNSNEGIKEKGGDILGDKTGKSNKYDDRNDNLGGSVKLIFACVGGKLFSVDYINYECMMLDINSEFGPVTAPITSIACSYKGLFLRYSTTEEILFVQLDDTVISFSDNKSFAPVSNNTNSGLTSLSIIKKQTLTSSWCISLNGGYMIMSGISTPNTSLTSKIALLRSLNIKGIPLELSAIDNILGKVVLCAARDGKVTILLCTDMIYTPISFNLGVTWPAGCMFHPSSCGHVVSLTEQGVVSVFDAKGKELSTFALPKNTYSSLSCTREKLVTSSTSLTPLICLKAE